MYISLSKSVPKVKYSISHGSNIRYSTFYGQNVFVGDYYRSISPILNIGRLAGSQENNLEIYETNKSHIHVNQFL